MNTETVFKTLCLKCGQDFAAPLARAGQPIICPHCQREVELPAEPSRSAIIEPVRPPILILPNAMPINVAPPGIALALYIVASLQILGGASAFLLGLGLPLAAGLIVSAIAIAALAQLVTSAHESATRLARLELFFQDVVNRPK